MDRPPQARHGSRGVSPGWALLVGMPMGIAWSVAIAFGLNFLDIDRMVRTHGALNSLAVLLVALAAPRSESP